MVRLGFVVDVDNFCGDGRQLRFDALILGCSAPFSGSRSFEPAIAQKPRSRQGATRVNLLQTTHGYSRRAT